MATQDEINREIDRLWQDALAHRAAAWGEYINKLDNSGWGNAEAERQARQADRAMRQHEQAAGALHDQVNALGALRRKLFGR